MIKKQFMSNHDTCTYVFLEYVYAIWFIEIIDLIVSIIQNIL